MNAHVQLFVLEIKDFYDFREHFITFFVEDVSRFTSLEIILFFIEDSIVKYFTRLELFFIDFLKTVLFQVFIIFQYSGQASDRNPDIAN